MNLQQLKEEAASLSHDDRLALQAFLIHLGRVDDPHHRRDLSERLQRMANGETVSLDEFIRLNSPTEIAS